MGVSKERIDELFEQMLDNANEDGWCYMPENLSDEEERELSKHLTIITMRDRIDTLMENINGIIKYITQITLNVNEYDVMDKIKIKESLDIVRTDSQETLIDLHSNDIISDFFNIEMIEVKTKESIEEANRMKVRMTEMVDEEFSDELETIKVYCGKLITMSDELLNKLND
jgi:hypothetical protein